MANTEEQGGEHRQQQQGDQRQSGQQEQGSQQSRQFGGQHGRERGARQLRLQERGREAYGQAQQLASTLEQAVDEIGQFLREQAERRPYVTVATATGIGYVLGGGRPVATHRLALRPRQPVRGGDVPARADR